MNHSAGQAFEGSEAIQAKVELLRRALLVQKALALLARLKAIQAMRSSSKALQPAKPSTVASNYQVKLSLAILLDQDALEALLGDLEAALADCSGLLEPESQAAGAALINELAVHGENSSLKFSPLQDRG